MRSRGFAYRTILSLAVVGIAIGGPSPADAQPGGVLIDAQGVLHKKTVLDPGGRLMRQRIAAATAALDPQVAAFSKLRKISINRLERIIQQRGDAPTGEMRNLAGLLRVRYVFYYPETKDIVIAGPAEGWVTNPAGRVVGIKSGRPVVPLQDLVAALRAFGPAAKGAEMIECSIDPRPEGLAAMQRFLRTTGPLSTPPSLAQTAYITNGLRDSLGLHDVRITGVSPKTHFAQVMVEADYRMKLIGIGLEKPPIRLVSYVARATPSAVSRNALQRWFFMPDYECVRVSEDGLAMQLVGDGVKLVGENELVTAGGQRRRATRQNRASQAFVTGFTKKYPELADRSPVYAELRNLIDLAIAAAHIQKADYYGKAGWRVELFGSEKDFAIETYSIPKAVRTAVNAIRKGNRLMTPVAGGVSINARRALATDKLLPDTGGKVAKLRKQITLNLAKDQWWWD